MKPISEITETATKNIKIGSTSTTQIQAGISRNPELTEEAKDYINKIFERMIVICPAWKASATGSASEWAKMYKSELAAAIKDAGVKTGEQIKSGLAVMRSDGKPFLPAPGQFAKHCVGETDSGLTHNTAAYRKTWEQIDPSQRQLCHKRSEEQKELGLKKVQSLKKAISNRPIDR